jgi:hypothetical protein
MRAIGIACVFATAFLANGCASHPPKETLKAGSERESIEEVLGDPIERHEVESVVVNVYSHHEARPYYRDCYGYCASGNALMHLFQELLDPVFKTYVITYDHSDSVIAYAALEGEEVWAQQKLQLYRAREGHVDSQYWVSNFQWLPDEFGVSWLCKAAHGGHPRAPFNLGRLHYYGLESVQEDYVQAYAWYSLARTSGYKEPNEPSPTFRTETGWRCCFPHPTLDELSEKMTSAEIAEAERLAVDWKTNPLACELDIPKTR